MKCRLLIESLLINECKKLNIEVKSPDINVSYTQFYPVDSSTISYGLNAIKNVGEKALQSIIENREDEGSFETIFEFCSSFRKPNQIRLYGFYLRY